MTIKVVYEEGYTDTYISQRELTINKRKIQKPEKAIKRKGVTNGNRHDKD